ncbi:MAG: PIG-L family deacetylase, partial [Thermoanaerobaculia bacterium]
RLECHLLVLTRGEAGICLLPGGCLPDLATVRAGEMQAAADLFGAGLTQWTLPDGGGLAGWAAAAGGHAALVGQLRNLLQTLAPDLVLTFDPRHGSTCHGDHKATAELVIEAHGGLATQPALVLLETRASVTATQPYVTYSPAGPARAGVFGLAATLDREERRGTWSYAVLDAGLHRSQFAPETVRALRRMPGTQRVVYLAPAATVLAADDVISCP